jgi:hypothetical protein
MAPATARQTYRALVADVAARAKAKLPACNGRVESATALVLAGDVFCNEDGSVEVGSCTDPLTMHRLAGSSCTCEDFQYGRAPGSWCKHRLAHAIYTRVQEELARRGDPEPEVELPADFEPHPDNDHEGEEVERTDIDKLSTLPQPAAVPLPEAPASVNVRVQIAGREVQWTLRDTDEARLAARLDALLARYPLPQAPQPVPQATAPQLSPQQYNAAAMHRPTVGFCAVHNVQMLENVKNGQRWWSHRLPEGGFCKGR